MPEKRHTFLILVLILAIFWDKWLSDPLDEGVSADNRRFCLLAEICLGTSVVKLGGGGSTTSPRSFENS
jgi:hypothetical protein